MTNPIVDTALKVMPDLLQLQWGMTIENKKLLWKHDKLEVRLYSDPPIHFTDCKPTTDLFPTEKSSSMGSSVSLFGVGGFSGGKSETRKRFIALPQAQDARGQRYYPVQIDVGNLKVPDAAAIYPAITWTPVDKDWQDQKFTLWVVIGRTVSGCFEEAYSPKPYEHKPDKSSEIAVLPEVEIVPRNERVSRRGTRPRLFISYASDNVGFVNEMARRLSNEYYYDVWIDYDSIRAGRNWKEELSLGIQEASAVLFMMTPESLKSDWCRAELDYARKHGKPIIPLRLNKTIGPEDITEVAALKDIHYRDFVASDTEPAWKKLIEELHGYGLEVPSREIALLENPKLGPLHKQYLQHLFTDLNNVDLTYIPDAKLRKSISLLDIYVPLRLGISFNIEVEDEKYVDWWLREVDKPIEKPEDESIKDVDKPKSLNGFKPDKDAIDTWEQVLKEGWERKVAEHDTKQAEKPEDKREKLTDGTWYWNRIESETAPALMKYLVITGDAGSGKSTLLRHMALAMAGHQLEHEQASLNNLGFWPHPAYTPLFISLRSLIATAFPNPKDEVKLKIIQDYIRDEVLETCGVAGYSDFLQQQMMDGDVIFLLDGLDEVLDAEARRDQVQAIIHELKTYDKCRIIVTSRPYAYYVEDWQLNDFGHVDLVTLQQDRLDELARRLFRAVMANEAGAITQINSFSKQKDRVPDELKTSPLFFTLLASIWLTDTDTSETERLPDTRAKMYRKSVEMLIARWARKDAERDAPSLIDLIGIDEAELRQVLELLAYRVLSQMDEDAETGDKDPEVFRTGEITNTLEDLELLDKVRVRELRDALANRAGIIYAKSDKRYRFSHRSLMEYLSACYLAYPTNFPDRLVAEVLQSPTKWRNALELISDELSENELWLFVRRQLPTPNKPLPATAKDPRWWLLYYACRWVRDKNLLGLEPDDFIRDVLKDRLLEILTPILELGALEPPERAEMGRLLAEYGDPRPGVGVDENGLPEIVWGKPVPPGTYIIGDDTDISISLDEQQVDIDYEYKLAKYPVTYAQFEAFVKTDDWQTNQAWWEGFPDDYDGLGIIDEADGSFVRAAVDPRHQNHPCEIVSWYRAVAFCRWLTTQSRAAGKIGDYEEIRLPTEKEWEIAARFNDSRYYAWGNSSDATKANTNDGNKVGSTSPVGMYPTGANENLDLCDMSGNVWEWTMTEWQTNEDSLKPSVHRVLRGGSFQNSLRDSRCYFRIKSGPDFNYNLNAVGFRLCCAAILKPLDTGAP